MTNLQTLEIDYEASAAYLRYGKAKFAYNERISEDVVAHFGAEGNLLGIEMIALDEDAMAQARRYAMEMDVAFPGFPAIPQATSA